MRIHPTAIIEEEKCGDGFVMIEKEVLSDKSKAYNVILQVPNTECDCPAERIVIPCTSEQAANGIYYTFTKILNDNSKCLGLALC